MQVQQLVRTEGQVIKIVTLKEGDVYKRLSKSSYGDTRYQAFYGVVQTVDSNGDDVVITAVEFNPAYNRVQAKVEVYGTDDDLALFAVTVDEVTAHFSELAKTARSSVDSAERELTDRRHELDAVDDVLTRARVGQLQAAETAPAEITG